MAGPLDGVRVLEFSQIVAGPFAGVALSDLGAEVVKLEPPSGDPYRNAGAVVPGEGKRFHSLNRGKRSLVVDLQDERGRELVQRIVSGFDVLVINYREGVAERLGIDYATLSAIHPALIYCRMSGFGRRGPAAGRAATDIVAQAYSGLMAGDGKVDEGGAPERITSSAVSDYATGLAAAMAICAALYHRRSSGEGQLIDATLLRSALAMQDTDVMREPVTDAVLREPLVEEIERVRAEGGSYADVIETRTRLRSRSSPLRLYYRGYLAKDGALVLGCLTPATRDAARRALGIANDPSEQPIYDPLRTEHLERMWGLKDRMEETFRSRTVAEWMTIFAAEGVPAAPVNLPEDMADDPQVVAEGIMHDLDHESVGAQRVVGPIVEMSATPAEPRGPAPPLGRHTEELLRDAGLSAEEVAALRHAGVIG